MEYRCPTQRALPLKREVRFALSYFSRPLLRYSRDGRQSGRNGEIAGQTGYGCLMRSDSSISAHAGARQSRAVPVAVTAPSVFPSGENWTAK